MIKRFFNNNWAISIVSGIVVFIVTVSIWNHEFHKLLYNFLNFSLKIKIWWALSGIALLFIIWRIFKEIYRAPYLKYKSDDFELPIYNETANSNKKPKLLRWEWDYIGSQKKPKISDVNPICPKCNTIMKTDYDYSDDYQVPVAICPRCFCRIHIPEHEDILYLIQDNIRRKNAPNGL